ncbi:MAG TPA: PepSY domain-containing protein, partial [Symbiobacteriaceae bacterium]|nr:PepSY domain-containing protein [Symbiobacteriaceae bacterium]
MFRRFIGSLTVGLLVVSLLAAPVLAEVGAEDKPADRPEPQITSEQAQQRLEEFFTLPKPSTGVELQWGLSSRGAGPVWELNITIREGNGATGFSIATVDAVTGRILSYNGAGAVPGPVRVGPLDPVRTEAEARGRAWALVQKVAPDRAPALHDALPGNPGYISPAYYPWGDTLQADAYQFTWIEHHEGIPVPFSSVTVSVHKQTLEYLSLQVNLAEGITYEAGPAKVTPEAALERWQSAAKPQLTYQPVTALSFWGKDRTGEFRLVYSYGGAGRQVDAMTGDWAADPSPVPALNRPEPKPAEPEVVPPGDVKPVLPAALPLTEMEAHKLALELLDLPAGADLHGEAFPSGPDPAIRLQYYTEEASGSVQFDPKTGLILGAYRSSRASQPGGPGGQPVTPEQEAEARQVAVKVVQTYYSQYLNSLRLEPAPQIWGAPEEPTRRFWFTRYVGGMPVPGDGIWVNVDTQTMQWRDLSASWTEGASFPSPVRALTPGAAREIFLAGLKPVLVYRPVYPAEGPEMNRWSIRQPTEAELVYSLVPGVGPYQVDALTGLPLDWDGLPFGSLAAANAKVAGHWAEGALRFMIGSRAVRADRVDPDAPLTRGEAVTLLLTRSRSVMRNVGMNGPVQL